MTLINTYSNEAEAYIDKGFLENHGIESQVDSNAISTIFPGPGNWTGNVSLYVADDKAEEARQLLADRPKN